VGGLIAHDFPELLACVDRALDTPTCCAALSAEFNRRHVTSADGRTCERIAEGLQEWLAA
jgi:hypothetical protein